MQITQKEFIYPAQDRMINSCHASTLVMLPDGDILAAWFGGEREGAGNVEIWSSRRHEGLWSTPVMLSDPSDIPCWNPVLYFDKNEVLLFYKRGDKIFRWKTFIRRSQDGGVTWNREKELISGDTGGRGPVKNKPILLSNGDILAPASHEGEGGEGWYAFCDRSSDGGKTWIRSQYIKTDPYVKLIQPTLWESRAGVHMLLRSASGYIYRSDSTDHGRTWGQAYKTILPNNNSGIDLVKTSDNTLALVCNPVGSNWGKRSPLIIITSANNGITWSDPLNLAEGEGEFSYPAIIFAQNKLHITFTWQRKTIAYYQVAI